MLPLRLFSDTGTWDFLNLGSSENLPRSPGVGKAVDGFFQTRKFSKAELAPAVVEWNRLGQLITLLKKAKALPPAIFPTSWSE